MPVPEIPDEYLGDYARILGEVAGTGRRLTRDELESRRALGREAAEAGFQLRSLVGLHLAATRAAWPSADATDPASTDCVLAAVEQCVDSFAEGFERAQRLTVRREEAARREFIDDLLYGRSDLGLPPSGPPGSGCGCHVPMRSRWRQAPRRTPRRTACRGRWSRRCWLASTAGRSC